MDAFLGLIGVLAGATIAFFGQFFASRSERRERHTVYLLEQCAVLAALTDDFQNRVWEERHLGAHATSE